MGRSPGGVRAAMHFEVDPRSPRSPREQLADQVRFGVASGRLAAGERLPSVRKLAAEVVVNPNTVGKTYRELELEGVLESRPGAGVFVAPGSEERCRARRDHAVRERLERAVRDAENAGLSATEIRALLNELLRGPRRRAS